ncbi:MAG: uncharacterized protein PWR03_1316 [Tenuifilum sp.]|jgi:hypothetical protein|uniref:hypothetical protein n=1 Tax=Tenuifilum sp. TaxID=2760880 RepID=UPI0024AA2AE2|nr:hypothetical protein [Tenuifilum sp.]MDI3527133.1 uncharacterized protein [Tenuifilum sp.]
MKKLVSLWLLGIVFSFGAHAQKSSGMYFNMGSGYIYNTNQPDFYKYTIGRAMSFGLYNHFMIKSVPSKLNFDFSLNNFNYQADSIGAVALQNKIGVDFFINPFHSDGELFKMFLAVGVYSVFQTRSFEPSSNLETINDGFSGYAGLAFKVNYVFPIYNTDKHESALSIGFAFCPKGLLIGKSDIPKFTTSAFTLGFQFGRKR